MVINIQDDILRLRVMGLLSRLLQDKTTKGNILWATDAYAEQGDGYGRGEEIRAERITGNASDLIKTRARRAMEQRTERTRQHAEVFTPLWIVKKMNDFADEQWFGRKDGIYKRTDEGKIYFTKDKHWKLYVDARRLEITCGEAPFLVTRYDVETGEAIPVEERIGLLDRKLRAVTENARDLEEWQTWALRAVQATYGYELQGDNLLIARVNVLCSVEEHMMQRWKQRPDKSWLEKLCNVIAWNLWQMDGIKGCVPVMPTPTEEQLTLFPGELGSFEQANLFGETEKEEEIPCRLFDWRRDRSLSYATLREKGSEIMKFDFIVGNPPYQDTTIGDNDTYAPPIYDKFLDASVKIGEKVELIHPARFLFNAGSTPKAWNKKMLEDPHFKILRYYPRSADVFSNTDIKGGIAVSYHDSSVMYAPIGVFTQYGELNSILHKVRELGMTSFSTIIVTSYAYHLTEQIYQDYPDLLGSLSSGHDYDFKSNIFEKMSSVFFDVCPDDGNAYVKIMGRVGNSRIYKYIKRLYVNDVINLDKYKVFMSGANGSGKYGETLVYNMGHPGEGSTETYLSIGSFESESESIAASKYICTKFARALLGIRKVTQAMTPGKWEYVPLQDFTPASDIDWSRSIPEIDQQLYRKYGLDETEIAFIESHVKEMS